MLNASKLRLNWLHHLLPCIHHTLVDTSFKLISHVNQGVLCCEHAEQASSRGVLEGGGGGGGGANS